MKNTLPGVKPEHVWKAAHVLVLPGAIALIEKNGKRWSVAVFSRGGESTHTGSTTLAGAVREAQKAAKGYRETRIDKGQLRTALRNLINLV